MADWRQHDAEMPQEYPGEYPEDGAQQDHVAYIDYSQTGFEEEEYSDLNESLDDAHRFHMAMNVFNLISVLAGLAVILILVAILVSLITWLQSDITQSFTLITSQLN